MKRAASVLTLIAIVGAVALFARQAPPKYASKIVHVPAEKRLEAAVKGVVTGGTNELIPRDTDLGLRASMGKKNATPPIAEAEVHETFGHIYLIEEGSGTLVLGGELVDPKARGTEWRGSSIRGGQEFQMKKGDMITVQVGMPHQWKHVSPGGIAYLAIHSFPERNQPAAR